MSVPNHLQQLVEVGSSEVRGRLEASEQTLVGDFVEVLLADILHTQQTEVLISSNNIATARQTDTRFGDSTRAPSVTPVCRYTDIFLVKASARYTAVLQPLVGLATNVYLR